MSGLTYEQREMLANIRDVLDTVLWQDDEIQRLREERDYYRKAHSDIVNENIKHSEAMIGNILVAIIDKGAGK